jgi:phosphate transport system ATP-binding protein
MSDDIKIAVNHFSFSYDGKIKVLHDISINILRNEITCFIGPSGCGKSTLLKCINSVNNPIRYKFIDGIITIDGHEIMEKGEPTRLTSSFHRPTVGMVKQRYNLESHTIFDTVATAVKKDKSSEKENIDDMVEYFLKKVNLWDETKNRLKDPATHLSRGQQQRLSIAKAIASNPEILLLDCPTSALDPISRETVEDLLVELKGEHTVILVTNIMELAARVSAYTAFFYQCQILEYDKSTKIFLNPSVPETEYYVTHGFI